MFLQSKIPIGSNTLVSSPVTLARNNGRRNAIRSPLDVPSYGELRVVDREKEQRANKLLKQAVTRFLKLKGNKQASK